ncbi:hypothetical protein JTB14_027790 [Gonioctena quinquepunctata]|nr:hypothetical protein JTB14_027790 [Gonioctena quinquepunctata]
MTKVGPQLVLKLYKDLLRYGENIYLTDKSYFQKRIKKEFKKNRTVSDEHEIIYNFEKGLTLLSKQTIV